MHIEMRCNFYLRFDRNFEFPLIFINLQIVASLAIDSRMKQCCVSKAAILRRENSRGATARRERAVSRWPFSWNVKDEGAHCEIRKRTRKSGKFPEQCVVSIRVSVGVAMRWTLVQLREQGGEKAKERKIEREREREREERRLECRQATLHLLRLFTFATTHHPRGEPPTLGIPPRRGHLALYARYYFYKYTRYRISWSNSRGRRERKFDGIAQLIPFQRSSAIVHLWDPWSFTRIRTFQQVLL